MFYGPRSNPEKYFVPKKKHVAECLGLFYSAIKGASEKYSSIIIFLVASLHFP